MYLPMLADVRREPKVLGDLLPWDHMVEGPVMITRDGGLLTCYDLSALDLDGLSRAEQGVVMQRINAAIGSLDHGWGVWSEVRRVAAPGPSASTWPHPMAALLDEERRQACSRPGARWTNHARLALWFRPKPWRSAFWRQILFTHDGRPTGEYARIFDDYRATCDRGTQMLQGAVESITPLERSDLSTYLAECCSERHQPYVEMPDPPFHLNYQLSGHVTLKPRSIRPRLGTETDYKILRCLSLTHRLPARTYAAMMREALKMPFGWRLVTRYMPMTRVQAQDTTTKQQIHWLGNQKSWRAYAYERWSGESTTGLDSHPLDQAADADRARKGILSRAYSMGHLSQTFIVAEADEAEADHHIRALQAMMEGLGCLVANEDLGTAKVWLSTMPGQAYARVRKPRLTSQNFATLGLFHIPWEGHTETPHLNGPCLTQTVSDGDNAFGISFHVGNLSHAVYIGPGGDGKSTVLGCLDIAQFLRYPRAQVFPIDLGGSLRCVTLCLGGSYDNLGMGGAQIQVLAGVRNPQELPWIRDWLFHRLEARHLVVDAWVAKIVNAALRQLIDSPQLPLRMASLKTLLGEHGSYLDIKSNSLVDANGMSRRDARYDQLVELTVKIQSVLADYAEGGIYGHLFDAPRDTFQLGNIHTMALAELIQKNASAYPAMMELVLHRLEGRMDGRPTRIPIDEAWHAFSDDVLLEWLRTRWPAFRRDNVGLSLVAQSLGQLAGHQLTDFLWANCQTWLLFPNPEAMHDQVLPYYEGLGLHHDEIRQHIVLGQPMQDVYFIRPRDVGAERKGKRRLNLRLGPIAAAVCGANSKEDHAEMDALLAKYAPEEFPYHWLRAKGFPEAAVRVQRALDHDRVAEAVPVLLGVD